MIPFDLSRHPLTGIQLIEAGAGTGKTYTIAELYVRLVIETGLSPESILVVTFTNAATEELKDRIRRRLRHARHTAPDNAAGNRMDGAGDRRHVFQRLDDALLGFDRAAIYTIHGFCQKLLRDHAFATGTPLDAELMPDPTPLLEDVAADFWRRSVVGGPPELTAFILSETGGPAYFTGLMAEGRRPGVTILPELDPPELTRLSDFRSAAEAVRRAWPVNREAVLEELMSPDLSGTVFGGRTVRSGGGPLSPRQQKVGAWAEALDRYLAAGPPDWPVAPEVEKFTSVKIAAATRKGRTPPAHPFFDRCQTLWDAGRELTDEMAASLPFLQAAFLRHSESAIDRQKSQGRRLFYDDLLLRVEAALSGSGGDALAARIAERYRAALVDEFQDTDSVQYAIFARLFSDRDALLVMIGDPKQAIYGFRGADIYSYLTAVKQAGTRRTLTVNWRSTAPMIRAVNTIFSNVRHPFVFPEITFSPAVPAVSNEAAPEPTEPALTLWTLPFRDGRALPKEEAVDILARAVAGESAALIRTGTPAGDMAVLVRTNRQARIVKAAMAAQGVPAVLYSAGSVFDTPEAEEMGRFLAAVAEPGVPRRVRAALASDLLGRTGNDLFAAQAGTGLWERWTTAFAEYRRLWIEEGFIQMFSRFMADEGIRGRQLALPDGERRLTNVLHLSEIFHQETVQRHLGVGGLLKWVRDQLRPDTRRREEDQLRLESDALAVRIVTVHRSKGLEFPIVFCPFLWEGSVRKAATVLFHDPERRYGLALDLGSAAIDRHRQMAHRERLAENLRLLYVGLTRARKRCYTAWGRIHQSESSALAYVMHGHRMDEGKDPVDALHDRVRSLSDAEIQADIERLVAASDGSVATIRLQATPPAEPVPTPPDQRRRVLQPRPFRGSIDRSWQVTSYSRLTRFTGRDLVDFDYDADPSIADTPPAVTERQTDESSNIARFPAGARSGMMFHEVFERLDFTETDPMHLERLVENRLAVHGFDPAWKEAVCGAVRRILAVPLTEDVRLASVTADRRLSELEFLFPLKRITPERLADVVARFQAEGLPGEFPEAIGRLQFSPVRGYLKGFIDLVFCDSDRFFLVDWKSNRLGDDAAAYAPPALARTMASELYTWQYLLYTLALHLYLERRVTGYRYERHFGGVFYVFLRGVGLRQEPGWGIFAARPPADMVTVLARELVEDYGSVDGLL